MWKIAALVWIMLGTVVAGSLVLLILANPAWVARGMTLIPFAAIGGYLLAVPFAIMIARRIAAQTGGA
jgi:hypothetical protein